MERGKFSLRAFTLVELLVVIGIIALLISILLPALSSAQRAAQATKCAASLRSLGQAFQLYAIDYKGYAPPWRAGNTSADPGDPGGPNAAWSYNLYGIGYNAKQDVPGVSAKDACFWFDFLAKYVTKAHGGAGDATAVGQKEAQSSVIWGCPAWQGYSDNSSTAAISAGGAGLNRSNVGYAYNDEPQMGPGYALTGPINGDLYYGIRTNDIRSTDNFTSNSWMTNTQGLEKGQHSQWFKLTDYRPASERALVGDAYGWKLETQVWNGKGLPPQQKLLVYGGNTYASLNGTGTRAPGTTFDLYRHGIYPKEDSTGNYYQSKGGKVSYNILYADGHVLTSNDRADAYRSQFIIFPVLGLSPVPAGVSNALPD